MTSDDSVLGRGFISHSPKISCQFATKISIFFIFGNHIKNHTTFLQVLAKAAKIVEIMRPDMKLRLDL
jgi:hypothetical protein